MKKLKIGLLGFGTVGQGVYELLEKNKSLIKEKTGLEWEIKKILVRDKEKRREVKVPSELLTTDPYEILEDREVNIICELMGGIEPAITYILKALEKGKHLITANKAVLAERGEEVFKLAQEKGVFLGFEASVAGGIPIIKTLRESLIGNQLERIMGIINGTTNYILTKMLEEDLSFERSLEEAKAKGYAESDPSFDLSGKDSAHKLSILASLAFGNYIPYNKVYVEGIEEIEVKDLQFAKNFGYVVKLIAEAQREKNQIVLRVFPSLLPENHILSSVRLNYNAIYVKGDFVGEVLLYGLGAGKEPTASAVVSDIVSAGEYIYSQKIPLITYPKIGERSLKIKPIEDSNFKYYFRFMAVDKPGVLSKIAGVLGEHKISIASVVQIGRHKKKGTVPLVILIHETQEKRVKSALKEIERLDVVKGKTKVLRILE